MLLAEKERRTKLDPLKYARQHAKQLEALKDTHAIRSLFWGNRVGKTEWGAQETARYVLGEHPYRKINLPIETWCSCPSYDQQKETTQKKLQTYLPTHRIADITYVKKNTWGEVVLDNGSKISFKSYEQGREKFQGVGKRLIWFDEEPPHDIWEECFVRSEAGIPLDIILTMTAIKGMTWVYDELYLNTANPDLFVSTAGWDDNPFLTEKQKEQMARGLSPEALKVRKEGKFVRRVGMVAPWWDRSIHLGEIIPDPYWQIGASMDFGFSHPAAFELIGADYDDNLNIFDGFYGTEMTTPTIGKKIVELFEKHHLQELTIVADSAQAQDIQELNDYFGEIKANITVIGVRKQSGTNSENWDEYRARKMQEYGQVINGKTKVKVSKDLIWFDEKEGVYANWFVKEVENLKWDETLSPTGDKQQGGRWDSKYPNHAIDTFTYYLVDHLEKPDKPKDGKPWEGKIPGTFIPPVEEEENSGDFFKESHDDYWDDDNG
jgi:phage terminase large subunit-like protein